VGTWDEFSLWDDEFSAQQCEAQAGRAPLSGCVPLPTPRTSHPLTALKCRQVRVQVRRGASPRRGGSPCGAWGDAVSDRSGPRMQQAASEDFAQENESTTLKKRLLRMPAPLRLRQSRGGCHVQPIRYGCSPGAPPPAAGPLTQPALTRVGPPARAMWSSAACCNRRTGSSAYS
jgi:hypothetical protein